MAVLDRCIINTSPMFIPGLSVISDITKTYPAIVTTATNHDYVDGGIVRFYIQPACGMQQLDQQTASILVTSLTTFTADIDTTNFEPFSIPVAPDILTNICSLVCNVGEISSSLKSSVTNIL